MEVDIKDEDIKGEDPGTAVAGVADEAADSTTRAQPPTIMSHTIRQDIGKRDSLMDPGNGVRGIGEDMPARSFPVLDPKCNRATPEICNHGGMADQEEESLPSNPRCMICSKSSLRSSIRETETGGK